MRNPIGRRALIGAAVATEPLLSLLPARAAVSPTAPGLLLTDGNTFPFATFGVQIYDDATARELTLRALQAGFRSFFTSPEAGNQRGFATAIRESGIDRSELYIAGTVLSDDAEGYRKARAVTRQRCEESLAELAAGGVDRLDMLMLERPGLSCSSIQGQWAALEEARAASVARSLGTCNFELDQLDCLARAQYQPQLNQILYTLIRMPHASLRAEHERRNIKLMAFSPLGGPVGLLPRSTLDACAAIGQPRRKSKYQVALRWLVQQNVAYSVHSRDKGHLKDDLDVFSFALSEEEMARLEGLSEQAPLYY